jgi:hypothetical protein
VQRQGRDYTSYLAKNPAVRMSATCKQTASCTVHLPSQATTKDTEQPCAAASLLAAQQPHQAAAVVTANEPSPPNKPSIQLIPLLSMPQSEGDWEADNSILGSTLVQQVMVAQRVLCDGVYTTTLQQNMENITLLSQPLGARGSTTGLSRR